MHLPPTSVASIGHTDQANHQYDTAGFWAAADAGQLPAVSYLKAPGYQDGHAGYSDPLDEQAWLTGTINHLESLRTWPSTAVVVTWDDSDGWYDSILGPIATQSQTSLDSLTGAGACGSDASQVPVNSADQPEQGRCGSISAAGRTRRCSLTPRRASLSAAAAPRPSWRPVPGARICVTGTAADRA